MYDSFLARLAKWRRRNPSLGTRVGNPAGMGPKELGCLKEKPRHTRGAKYHVLRGGSVPGDGAWYWELIADTHRIVSVDMLIPTLWQPETPATPPGRPT